MGFIGAVTKLRGIPKMGFIGAVTKFRSSDKVTGHTKDGIYRSSD